MMTLTAYRHLIAMLHRRYGDVMLRHDNDIYPVTVIRPEEDRKLDDLLADVPPDGFPEIKYTAYDQGHLSQIKATRATFNGVCYCLDRVLINPLKLRARLGHYWPMLATCDALDHESRKYAEGYINTTPLRDALHRKHPVADLLRTGVGREAVLGGAVLTVFFHDGHYRLIVAQRASHLAVGAGLYHVAPAFIFQPLNRQAAPEEEWSLRYQLLREFGEELFGLEEATAESGRAAVMAQPPVAELNTMLEDGRAEVHLTGIAVNLLSLRPEICALLVIHDPDWFTRNQAALDAAMETERQHTEYVHLDTLAGLPSDLYLRIEPQGAAALWLGVEMAREIVANR